MQLLKYTNPISSHQNLLVNINNLIILRTCETLLTSWSCSVPYLQYIPYTFFTCIQINQIWWNIWFGHIWFSHSASGMRMETHNVTKLAFQKYETKKTSNQMEMAEVRCVCHKWCRPTATSTGSTSLTNKRSLDYVRGHYLGGRGGTKLEGSLCPQYRHKLVSGSAEPGSGLLNRYSHSPYKCCTLHTGYLTLTALSVPYRPASQFMFTLLRWFFLRGISPLRRQILVLFPKNVVNSYSCIFVSFNNNK